MIKSRETLERSLTERIKEDIARKQVLRGYMFAAQESYGIPFTVSSDYITLRKNMMEADTFTLFILTDVVFGEKKLKEYFSSKEIKELSKAKWHIEKASFPLVYEMTKINGEQYIGRISVKELMLLKDAQLINYNENAQRTMKHIVRGETEFFQISLNKEAVKAIMNSYNSDLYIPNTITLNLPEDAEYEYDEKKKQLIINKADYLDILDGYHRYIAMSKICATNKDFDYDMELRIVQFSEGKAKRFIWQEDQKTKMRKIDSDAMDTAKASNMIIERLNSNPNCILAGKISRNHGIINASYFSNIIEVVLLKGIKKSEERKYIKTITNQLLAAIEYMTDIDPKLIDVPWDKKVIYTMVYEIKYGDIRDAVQDCLEICNDSSIYAGTTITPSDITRTHKLLGKGGY